jgi:VCBS repeat-containing protein
MRESTFMATTSIIGTKVVFSNSGAAVSETYYTSDVTLDIIRYFDVLAQDGGGKGKFLWSIGTSQISASGWTTQGAISVPTELLAQDTSYNIDSGLYRSALGANIFLTGATGLVGYDMSAMSAATKLQIDNLAVSQSITDSFDYAIRLGNGTLSWNTVRVVINGAPASIAVTGGYVVENQNVGYDGKLTDIESLSVRAASGDATSFTIAPKSAGTLGAITGLGGVLNADGSYTFLAGTGAFTYAVSNQAVLATHLGYGESQKEWFTITTANGTTADFYETVDGNINAPVVTASAAQASIKQGASVGLNISATDNDDNARLTYTIADVPAGAILSSAADPGGVAYDPGTQSWTVAAGALGDLTLTLGPQFTQQIALTVTVYRSQSQQSERCSERNDHRFDRCFGQRRHLRGRLRLNIGRRRSWQRRHGDRSLGRPRHRHYGQRRRVSGRLRHYQRDRGRRRRTPNGRSGRNRQRHHHQ